MRGMARNKGLSLTEVLLAAGILVLGFLLIAGTFPVGIKLTSLATERTISLVAAQEAAGKIKLYGVQPDGLLDLDNAVAAAAGQPPGSVNLLWEYGLGVVDPNGITAFWRQARDLGASDAKAWEAVQTHLDDLRRYPSVAGWQVEDYRYLWAPTDLEAVKRRQRKLLLPDGEGARYFWTALCRRLPVGGASGRDVQVTVFVGRKAGAGAKYVKCVEEPQLDGTLKKLWTTSDWPVAVPIPVQAAYDPLPESFFVDELNVSAEYASYITVSSVLVDRRTGQLMRVREVGLTVSGGAEVWRVKLLPRVHETSEQDLYNMSDALFDVRLGALRDVWVMPPAINEQDFTNLRETPPVVGGRYPGVGVYQWVLSF